MNANELRLPLGAALAAVLAATLIAPALADTLGPHPYDVHALSDLRHAAALENHPDEINVVAEQRTALADIRSAIGAAAQAAGDDGKNLGERFPVDGPQDRRSRLLLARSERATRYATCSGPKPTRPRSCCAIRPSTRRARRSARPTRRCATTGSTIAAVRRTRRNCTR